MRPTNLQGMNFVYTRTRTCLAAFFLMMGILVAGSLSSVTAQDNATPEASPEAAPAVVRDVLGSDDPESAPGELFELARYTIPAHFALPVHIHPGVQMAVVESGTLTYHVVENGSIEVTWADGTEELIGPGETATFTVGDSWVEPEGMVHYAENLTDEPVILLSSSLLDADEPTAILVDEATPAAD